VRLQEFFGFYFLNRTEKTDRVLQVPYGGGMRDPENLPGGSSSGRDAKIRARTELCLSDFGKILG
jgi:hypothetical protein